MMARYEQLRTAVLRGQAPPEGLGAVVYHGLLEGMKLLCSSSACGVFPLQSAPVTQVTRDRELLRLLANMVLQTQSEVMHVY